MKTPNFIIHIQNWEKHKSWYIFEEHGIAMIRVTMYRDNPKTLWLSDLYVQDARRREGFAKALLELVVEKADLAQLNLECTVTSMSENLFKQFGFVLLENGNYVKEFRKDER